MSQLHVYIYPLYLEPPLNLRRSQCSLWVEFLDHMITYLTCWGTAWPFSVVTTSFLIPVRDVWRFQLLHILTMAWMGVRLYLMHIFTVTNEVEFFSCAYCPFVYLLQRNIYLDLSLKVILSTMYFFVCLCVLSCSVVSDSLWPYAL